MILRDWQRCTISFKNSRCPGLRVAPDKVNLVVDADDTGHNNCPDPINNHGATGWNWGFADGHAEWITCRRTAQAMTESFMVSGVAGCDCQ